MYRSSHGKTFTASCDLDTSKYDSLWRDIVSIVGVYGDQVDKNARWLTRVMGLLQTKLFGANELVFFDIYTKTVGDFYW